MAIWDPFCPQWRLLSSIDDFERCGKYVHVVGGGKPTSILKNKLTIVLGPRIKYNPHIIYNTYSTSGIDMRFSIGTFCD
jgi:hypothetical protein